MSRNQSQWILAEVPEIPPDIDNEIPEILVRMMAHRGIPPEEMQQFLHPRLMDAIMTSFARFLLSQE